MLTFLVVFSILLCTVVGQNHCPVIIPSDLGNVNTPSNDGLVPPLVGTSIQILEANVVCLAQGSVKDTYRWISIIVRYLRDDNMMEFLIQVQYQCTAGVWQGGTLTPNPVGTLTTSLKTDCFLCFDPRTTTAVTIDPDTHCVGKAMLACLVACCPIKIWLWL